MGVCAEADLVLGWEIDEALLDWGIYDEEYDDGMHDMRVDGMDAMTEEAYARLREAYEPIADIDPFAPWYFIALPTSRNVPLDAGRCCFGVRLGKHEETMAEFATRISTRAAAYEQVAHGLYRLLTGREPDAAPIVINFAQISY